MVFMKVHEYMSFIIISVFSSTYCFDKTKSHIFLIQVLRANILTRKSLYSFN